MFKKIFAGILAVSAVFGSVMSASAASSDDITLSNDYIGLFVDRSAGNFSLGTVKGNPDIESDDNKNLLYRYTNERATSYCSYVIDGKATTFTSASDTPSEDNLSTSAELTDGNITVIRTLSIVDNISTNRADVLKVELTIINNDDVSHTAGGRIMLDTMLAGNDAAPFRVPGVGAVATEMEFEGDDIPTFWQAFDSFYDPGVTSQGTFIKSGYLRPDKVQFADWWHVRSDENNWDYTIRPDYSYNDSAVTINWYEKELAAGESRTYTTFYGMSEFSSESNASLALNAYCDKEVSFNDDEDSDEVFAPFDVTAYMNCSEANLNNAYLKITLPEGMTLADGESDTVDFAYISNLSDVQTLWKVNTDASVPAGDYTITVTAGADMVDSVSTDLTITVPEHEMPAPDPEPQPDPSSSESESSSESSSESKADSSSDSKADTSSKANTKVNTSSSENPTTGAAAGFAAASVGLAAVIVTKRKSK